MRFLLATILPLAHLLSGAAARAERPLPDPLRAVKFEPNFGAQVPTEMTFRDETGQQVALRDYCGGSKPVILVLAYYRCPMLCNLVLNGLTESLQQLAREKGFRVGREFTVVTISIDPRETPELAAAKKASYVEKLGLPGADVGWHFLTGDDGSITRLTNAVGFTYSYDAATGQYAHASGIVVLTPAGKIARCFYGVDFPARDLYFGLVEASQHRIGRPLADRAALLFCFSYNPATGTYQMTIINIVRIGAVLTLLALGCFLVVLRRRWPVASGQWLVASEEKQECVALATGHSPLATACRRGER